ncbi:MAG: elongation factor P [Patescibacteria group bacterium]|nr:elongation factor P [Patescibacteria group bacterium]
MLDIHKIKIGSNIELNNQPYQVLRAIFSKIGRQGAVLRTRLKNLKTGNLKEETFRDSDKILEAELDKKKAQYLYNENDLFYFMNQEDFDQFSLDKNALGHLHNFLKPNCQVEIIYFNQEPINIELPIKLEFEVTEAPPSIKGNTADGGTKKVKIQTGWELNAPLFINKGDIIKINTQDGSYVERV